MVSLIKTIPIGISGRNQKISREQFLREILLHVFAGYLAVHQSWSFLLLARFEQLDHFLDAPSTRFRSFGAFDPFDVGVSIEGSQ